MRSAGMQVGCPPTRNYYSRRPPKRPSACSLKLSTWSFVSMSTTSSSSLSQASTKINGESAPPEEPKSRPRQVLKHAVQATTAQDVLLFLIAFRILNALTIKTFFQPDEFFQSLEPAWQMVFGSQSGAWITWVIASKSRQRSHR